MKFEFPTKTIDFDLSPGVYSNWDCDSACGKTYTLNLLQSFVNLGRKDILLLTYDFVNAAGLDKVKSMVLNNEYVLIFADRADMYMDEELYDLFCKSGAIVFIDSKMNGKKGIYGAEAYIEMTEREIRYYEDNDV